MAIVKIREREMSKFTAHSQLKRKKNKKKRIIGNILQIKEKKTK